MSGFKSTVTALVSRFRRNTELDKDAAPKPVKMTRAQRDQAFESLTHGYHEVLELMKSVRQHLDKQSERSERLLQMMDGLPEALQTLPETNRNQSRMLEAMNNHLDAQRKDARQLNETISGLANSAESQTQLMSAMHKQFDSHNETDKRLVQSFGTLNDTLIQSTRSGEATLDFLRTMSERSDQTYGEMTELVKRNRRHSTALAATSWAIILVAMIGIVMVAMNDGSPGTPSNGQMLADQSGTDSTDTAQPAEVMPIATPTAPTSTDVDDMLIGIEREPVTKPDATPQIIETPEQSATANESTVEPTTDAVSTPEVEAEADLNDAGEATTTEPVDETMAELDALPLVPSGDWIEPSEQTILDWLVPSDPASDE